MPKDIKLNGTVYSGVKGVKLPLEEDTTQFATFEETSSSGGGTAKVTLSVKVSALSRSASIAKED